MKSQTEIHTNHLLTHHTHTFLLMDGKIIQIEHTPTTVLPHTHVFYQPVQLNNLLEGGIFSGMLSKNKNKIE